MGDIEFIYEEISPDEERASPPPPKGRDAKKTPQPGARLSEDFNRREFSCHCGCGFDSPNSKLVAGLQELRNLLGRAVTIHSACRCVQHNREVGGVRNSQHVLGKAADISITGLSPPEIARAAERVGVFEQGGIGIYDTFVHVDVRDRRARWDERKKT